MQKPPTRAHRQTAVGELGPVIVAKMSNDHNYIRSATSHSIVEHVNKCVREKIIAMEC